MSRLIRYILNFALLFVIEIVFSLLVFGSIESNQFVNLFVFILLFSTLFTFITNRLPRKANMITSFIIFGLIGLLFGIEFVYTKIFNSCFSWALLGIADQPLKFAKTTFVEILSNIYGIIIFFLPLVVNIVFRKKLYSEEKDKKELIYGLILIGLSIGLFFFNLIITKDNTYSMSKLLVEINEPSINQQKIGIINKNIVDIHRTLFGFEESIVIENNIPITNTDNLPKEKTYDKNEINIDFDSLSKKTKNKDAKKIDNYMKSVNSTYKNEYTGLFEGKNLIFIVAESFSDIAVREDLTPTLYKLVNSGFKFNNFYTPNNASTIGGEFQALTGLFADNSILSKWRSGKNYFPYGLATVFKKKGYSTYAYHNNSYTFQDRNKYLKSMGFTNFKACWNGLEKKINCRTWPQSDIEMFDKTMGDYINKDKKFLAYYMTVSGHFQYTYNDNFIASKNKKYVNKLKYSNSAKAYLATQIELDKALEKMIKKLKKAGKLDDTVIVLLADHYPYKLDLKSINQLSSYKKDGVVGVNKSNLIIWNNKLEQKDIDKTCMSIDVLPTVLNLYNIKYDSRLIVGKDIFSDEPGLAMMKNRSWISDYGTYYSSNNKIKAKNSLMTKEYVKDMNKVVSNRMNISRLIIKTNYYKHVFK